MGSARSTAYSTALPDSPVVGDIMLTIALSIPLTADVISEINISPPFIKIGTYYLRLRLPRPISPKRNLAARPKTKNAAGTATTHISAIPAKAVFRIVTSDAS